MSDGHRDPLEISEKGLAQDKTKSGTLLNSPSLEGETLPNSNVKPDNKIDFLLPPKVPGDLGSLSGFRIIKILGAGGMGLVFLAEDESLNRKLAIKVILPTQANQKTKERFLREARATAALHHDNVISIFQVGEDNGVPFLAMPLLQGMPLNKYLDEQRKLSVKEALRITMEGLAGLSSAHARNMVHRDIKPSNIWLEGARKKVILLDFGLAKGGSAEDVSLTHMGAIMGTPAYMSPEQAQAEGVDRRADLFSMGVVLYQMLTGEVPFKGKTMVAVLANLITKDPKPPCEVDPGIPKEVSGICMWMLQKDLEKRPRSSLEVGARIQAFEKGKEKSQELIELHEEHSPAKTLQRNPVKTHELEWQPNNIEELAKLYPEIESTWPRKKKKKKSSLVPFLMGLGGVLFFVVGLVFFLVRNEPMAIKPPKNNVPVPVAVNKGKNEPEPNQKQVDEKENPLQVAVNKGQKDPGPNQKQVEEKEVSPPPTQEQKEKEEQYLKDIANQEVLVKANPTESYYQEALASSHGRLAPLYWEMKRLKEAEESYLKGLPIWQSLVKANPTNSYYQEAVADAHGRLAYLYWGMKRLKEAEESYLKAIATYETLVKADPTNLSYRLYLAGDHYYLGDLYRLSNRKKEAEESYQKALAIYETLVKADPKNSGYQTNLAYTKNILENLRNH